METGRIVFWCIVCNKEVFMRDDNYLPRESGWYCKNMEHRIIQVSEYCPTGTMFVIDERPEP